MVEAKASDPSARDVPWTVMHVVRQSWGAGHHTDAVREWAEYGVHLNVFVGRGGLQEALRDPTMFAARQVLGCGPEAMVKDVSGMFPQSRVIYDLWEAK